MKPKVAEHCVICNSESRNDFDIDDLDKWFLQANKDALQCVRYIEEWAYHGYRTTEEECSLINNLCVTCKDERNGTSPPTNERLVPEGGGSLLENLDPDFRRAY